MKATLSIVAAAVVVGLAARASAQRPIVLPSEYDRAWGRGSSSALGGNSTRTQMVFAQPFSMGTPVFGVGLRPTASTIDRAAFTADIEVQMSSTPNAPGALDPTFANNVGSDMVVSFPQQTFNVVAMPANRSTGRFAQIPFAAPFVFGTNSNTNIMVDLFVFTRSTGASWSTDRGFASANGRATNAGLGCGAGTVGSSSTGGTYVAGASLTITLANATPLAPALLLPSVDMKEFVPGVSLPFALSLIGAGAGCDVLVNPSLGGVPLTTDATGAASMSVTVSLVIGQIGTGWQWVYVVPSSATNPLGLETTANRAIWIGPEVIVPNAQYVWDLSNVASPTGNSTTDSVPVVQFTIP